MLSSVSQSSEREGVSPGTGEVRIARYLAMAGIASRRACEELVREGVVTLNGEVVKELSSRVLPGQDRVCCRGQRARPERSVYVVLNKPAGYTCSSRDPHAVALARELLPANLGRLFSVGRLDRDSEGLLLFTNDGHFSERLAHPRHGVPKTYRVTFRGSFTETIGRRMRSGIRDGGELLRAERVVCVQRIPGGGVLELVLREGRKREIRRMCRRCNLEVERLIRTSIGELHDAQLGLGKWRYLTMEEVAALAG